MGKREFTIDTGNEQIVVEGQIHRNVAIKYLMKRRRSLLMTKDQNKIESLFSNLPRDIKIIGKQITRSYTVTWQRQGTEDFHGCRFVFVLNTEENDRTSQAPLSAIECIE